MNIARLLPLVFVLALAACREVPADRLYALPLAQAPAESDWERALPRVVTVRGGKVHNPNPLPDMDDDTVHVTTASCHHGSVLPDPVPVDLRAFYAGDELYLRLSWPDATRDDAMMEWSWDGTAWRNRGGLEDGFGIIWDSEGRFPSFSCAVACHIRDFGVAGASFRANNRMQTVGPGEWLDLWNWKAGRTGRLGFADDRHIDREGMHGDTPGEILKENSRFRAGGKDRLPFTKGDSPIYDAEGLPAGEGFLPAGTTAPGYLTERPTGGRADVHAWGRWEKGRWTVVLRRKLDTGDPKDVRFVPGAPKGVAFGLSVMDNTLQEHYASPVEERIVLLPPGGGNR